MNDHKTAGQLLWEKWAGSWDANSRWSKLDKKTKRMWEKAARI